MTLSKSQYIRGLQCPRSLWLYKHRPELRAQPEEETEALFATGYRVGDLAKELFPGGMEIAFDPEDFDGMIEKTRRLIEDGADVIYEATFKEGGIFAMADILVRDGDGWRFYEVKASTSVKGYQLDDAAIQWYVLSRAIPLKRAFVIHIDNTYVRRGELEIEKLFKIDDVTEEVRAKQPEIPQKLAEMAQMLAGEEPDIPIGPQCDNPFPCDFRDYCWKDVPTPSVFDLYRLNGAKKFALFHEGIVTYDDIPDGFALTPAQRMQVESFKSNKAHVDREKIAAFLKKIVFPINFFDFETFQEAIPRFDGQRPYQQIPFQYSLHILHEDGRLEHREFLGDEHRDPRAELIERMLSDITKSGSIVAFNQSFEIGRIRELAKDFPEYREALLALTDRFVDLIEPFRGLALYHPEMHGSFSIKSVLPALFPNDEELDYKRLRIQNGGMAMDTFANLHRLKDPSRRDEIRRALLDYCRLDTLAMVRIYERLATSI